MTKPWRVLAYRNRLLPISETFVYNQTIGLRRFEAFLLGSKRISGLELPANRVAVVNQGGVRGLLDEAAFKLIGFTPRRVRTWAHGIDPVLVHAHFGDDGAVVMPLARLLRLPMLVSFHGSDATLRPQYARRSHITMRIYFRRRAALARYARRVIVPSEFLKDVLITRHPFSEDRVVVLPHGVDHHYFRPTGANQEWGHVLYVGRLIALKGLHHLIRAIGIARRVFPKIRLTVVGEGPQRTLFEEQAARHLRGGFEFLGAQPRSVVRKLLDQAYVFSMPSITMSSGATEAFGLVLIEAQAMEVPVLSFRVGGVPEVVVHGETGFLAKEGDVAGLARYLMTLLDDPDLRNRMGRAGRARVGRYFDLRVQNGKLEDVYADVLSEAAHLG